MWREILRRYHSTAEIVFPSRSEKRTAGDKYWQIVGRAFVTSHWISSYSCVGLFYTASEFPQ